MKQTLKFTKFKRLYSSEVKFETQKEWRIVTLNRPKQLNSLNLNMVEKMKPLYEHWNHDNEIKGIILQGEGEKAFCAGGLLNLNLNISPRRH
jgi:enoyl-CoA hydratase